MSASYAGVAESIRVYHKPAFHSPDVHMLDIEWTDPSRQIHSNRVTIHTEHLRCPARPTYVCGETIPGVGQVLVDCPVLKEPTDEPQFGARLLRGVGDTIPIPVLFEVEDDIDER